MQDEADKLSVGDTVYLKSGSAQMTVTALLEDGAVECTWSDYQDREVRVHKFPELALARAKEAKHKGVGGK